MRSRIFCCILDVVASAYELDASEILGKSHAEEVVNARILVVHHLSRFGFSDTDIASRLHRTPQAVRHLKSLYACRSESTRDKLFAIISQTTRKRLENIDFASE